MKSKHAVACLSALAQEHRLAIFRLLTRAGPDGLAAGDIARSLKLVPATLSSHLAILSGAGLIASRREGRSIIYRADMEGMSELMVYLVEDCCEGRPEVCAPLAGITAKGACC